MMPSTFITSAPGADSPKRSMPMLIPSSPTYLAQVDGTIASIDTRRRHDSGRTSAR